MLSMFNCGLCCGPTLRPLDLSSGDVARRELVQCGLKVVKNYRVCQQLADKGQLPEWVNSDRKAGAEAVGYSTDVNDGEDERQDHGDDHDCKTW